MSLRQNFLFWSLGWVSRWSIEVESDRPAVSRNEGRLVREWVQVKDGPRMHFQYRGMTHCLKFGSKTEEREAREWLREVPQPFLMRIELNGTGEGMCGNLVFMRGIDPAIMAQPPLIVVSDEVLAKSGITDRHDFIRQAAEQMVVESPQGSLLMVAQVPTLVFNLFDDPGAPEVRIIFADGRELVCVVAGPPGREYLEAREVDSSRKFPRPLPQVKFIQVPDAPRIVKSADPDRESFLGAFRARRYEFLEAWLAYEAAESHCNREQFVQRVQHPLEYELFGPLDEQGCYPLRIIMAADIEKWISKEGTKKSGQVDTEAFVEIRPLRKSGNKPQGEEVVYGRLKAFVLGTEVSQALFEPDNKHRGHCPPPKGRIVAIEDFQNAVQLKRRRNAMDALLKGAAQMPELLGYLGQPDNIPSVSGKGLNYWQRPGAPVFKGPMQQALVQAAKEPRIFLVQGPPGTGKTTLIAEIIHQVLHRRRNRRRSAAEDGDMAHGPLRVLISSIQKDTVKNAYERLLAQGLQVDLYQTDPSDACEGDRLLCSETARKVIAKLEASPLLGRIKNLRELKLHLEEMAWAGTSAGIAEALSALRQADAAEALTPDLKTSLDRLLDRFKAHRADAARESAAGTPDPHGPAEMRVELEDFLKASAPMSMETAKVVGPLLDRLLARMDALGDKSPEAVRSAEANVVHLKSRLRVALKRGTLDDKTILAWRAALEATGACNGPAQDECGADLSGSGNDAADAIYREAHLWMERAAGAVRAEMACHENTDESILLQWAEMLQNEPATIRALKARHTSFRAANCQKAQKALALSEARDGRGGRSHPWYDLVIIDEAARAGIDILIPLVLARSVVLVGDHRQLPPYLEKQIYERMEQKYKETVDLNQDSMFNHLWQRAPESNKVRLTRQYRMHEDIGRLVSKVFYEPELHLEHHFEGDRARERAPAFGLCENRPLVWVDTSDELRENALTIWNWPCREQSAYEARLVLNLLEMADIDELRRANSGRSEPAVGVISFYKEQVKLLEAELASLPDARRRMVQVGTVDGFQGKEFPLVILSTVRSNRNGELGFLTLPHRINVALSRAQRQLIILGDPKTLAAKRRRAYLSKIGEVYGILSDPSWPGIVVASREVRV